MSFETIGFVANKAYPCSMKIFILILTISSQTLFSTSWAQSSIKENDKSFTCNLALKMKDPELGFIPKSIELIPVKNADGRSRWNTVLNYETLSPNEKGDKLVAIPDNKSMLLEIGCLKNGCFGSTREDEVNSSTNRVILYYFKTLPKSFRTLKHFEADVIVIAKNPLDYYVNTPIHTKAKCRAHASLETP